MSRRNWSVSWRISVSVPSRTRCSIRGDMPVVLCPSILHMVAFSALVAAGLQFVPAGRAIVLGYTTPIWVAIGASIFLSEAITARRAIGIGFGLAGLAVIFNPATLNW